MSRPTPALAAEELTLRMAAGIQASSNFAAEFSEEFPDAAPAFALLEAINEKVR